MNLMDVIVNNPAAARNADAIQAVLGAELEGLIAQGHRDEPVRVLEIASGPGQHIEQFAKAYPQVLWQPSEPEARLRASIDARVTAANLNNVEPALALDARQPWPAQPVDLVLAVNLLHIAPWEVTQALIHRAAKVLTASGRLVIYGPFQEAGVHNSQGNQAFDADLRARDQRWGIRDLEAVAELGAAAGLQSFRIKSMPANNRMLFLSA